ncbi:MAG TPA: NUDIX domain-containing protein [Chlamydiales bacterium]|nr:NUDIX domain-containing protein [Chlamydiales bacterium]
MSYSTRIGAYGVLIHDQKVLLIRKEGGPFASLWDLPGGGIEFSETPAEAFHRELREEAALTAHCIELFTTLSTHGATYHFVGIVYRVHGHAPIPDLLPEDEGHWFPLSTLDPAVLTPFARQALSELDKKMD